MTIDDEARPMTRMMRRSANAPAVPPAKQGNYFRPDIQGLRALAIALVFVYHLAPTYLTGGFIGVDVFFVISGYLISSHLLREAEVSGRLHLGKFYARRARRLLPASLTVLLLVAVVTLVAVPRTLWVQSLTNIAAAAAYFENWALAASSVDYLAAGTATNPVQHYWSLSTEEQFYLVWPLLVLIAVFIVTRRRAQLSSLRNTVAVVFGVVAAGSLVASVLWTYSNQSTAYFATPVRAWEFAVGGLVSLLPRFGPERWRRSRIVAGWAALLLIVAAALLFTGGTLFPGFAAALPVAGSALLLAVDAPQGRLALTRLLALRPVQWLGDVSYSLYLVHWPLLVLPTMIWPTLPYASRLLAVPAGLLVAALLNRFVERPFLRSPALATRLRLGVPRAVLLMTAGAMAVVILVCVPGVVTTQREINVDRAALSRVIEKMPGCLGALSVEASCAGDPAVSTAALVPSPLIAADDVADRQCLQHQTRTDVLTCEFGPKGGTPVALIGDSHAHQWLPVLRQIASERGWRVTTYLRANCPVLDDGPGLVGSAAQCAEWGHGVLRDATAAKYSFVFVSAHNEWNGAAPAASQQAAAFARAWRKLQASGARVVVVQDTPQPAWTRVSDPVSCVVTEKRPSDCSFGLAESTSPSDPLLSARRELPGVGLIDLNSVICPGGTCAGVQGGVVVYRDEGHLTSTYVRTLAQAFDSRLPAFAR
jgi:peptidoglycan/LPS O-acetylase OafA/YrhL